MITQAAQKELQEILQLVKNHIWTPEVFERCRNSDLINPCIFNLIRQVLEPGEYQQWDEAYCLHCRPQDQNLIHWLREKAAENERSEKEETWRQEKIQLLTKKKQLLKQKLQK